MQVLVTHGDRGGTTDGIARRVADRLRTRGVTVHLMAVGEVEDVEAYDAVVVGGGTAGTHWLRPARSFVQRHEEELARRPVWLFGSVPPTNVAPDDASEAATASARPREFDEFHRLVDAEDEAVFVHASGPQDKQVGLLARLRPWRPDPGGPDATSDVHDQPRVDAWADEIADRLEQLRRDRAIDGVHEMHDGAEMHDGESGGA